MHGIVEAEGHWPFLLSGEPLQGHQKNLRGTRVFESRAAGNRETFPCDHVAGSSRPSATGEKTSRANLRVRSTRFRAIRVAPGGSLGGRAGRCPRFLPTPALHGSRTWPPRRVNCKTGLAHLDV